MNAISFSLYGTDPKYSVGMIRNAELARLVYPGWTVVVYTDGAIQADVRRKLSGLGCLLRIGNTVTGAGLFWRFLIADDPQVDRFIIRDADSRLNFRERRAVAEWIASGKPIHLMRDHPYHRQLVMGGMWGAVRGAFSNMTELVRKHADPANTYSSDQSFMAGLLSHRLSDCHQHDSCLRHQFPDSLPFPGGLKMGDWRFCGEVFDEHDKPQKDQWEKRINYMEA